jgi:hypothetical protein
VFCRLADTLEAAWHNPMEFLHLANPRTLCLVLQRHGPFGQLAQLGAIVHEASETSQRCWQCASWRGTRQALSRSSAASTSSWCVSRRCRCPRTRSALEHLLEHADKGFKLLKVCAKKGFKLLKPIGVFHVNILKHGKISCEHGFFSMSIANIMLAKKTHVQCWEKNPMLT